MKLSNKLIMAAAVILIVLMALNACSPAGEHQTTIDPGTDNTAEGQAEDESEEPSLNEDLESNEDPESDVVLLDPSLSWLEKEVPPLPEPTGKVVTVTNGLQLLDAVNKAEPGTTIIMEEGTYRVGSSLILDTEGLTIRGASNDRSKVLLLGNGFDGKGLGDGEVIKIENAQNITVANLTIMDTSLHGITIQGHTSPHGVHIYNVGFIDIGQRSIKVNSSEEAPHMESGLVEYCYFEQKQDIAKGRNDGHGGDYVAGIDAHHIKDWIIRDNVFKNIRGANGGGRAAIFVWNRSDNTIAERNLIIGCDRGIAFGYPYIQENLPYHHQGGIIRNNLIFSPSRKMGMELVATKNLKVFNNTVVNGDPEYERAFEYGHPLTEGLVIKNNLVSGQLKYGPYEAGAQAEVVNNLSELPTNWFIDPANGNLCLTDLAKEARNSGINLGEDVLDDFFGNPRKGSYDMGAVQESGN